MITCYLILILKRLNQVPWYLEQYITDITVGGLLVVMLVRTVQLNLRRIRDLYLHTICMAALSNMAPHFTSLPAYSVMRLVKLMEVIHLKFERAQRHANILLTSDTFRAVSGSTAGIQNHSEDPEYKPAAQLTVYSGLLKQLLDVFNAAFAIGLDKNPDLM